MLVRRAPAKERWRFPCLRVNAWECTPPSDCVAAGTDAPLVQGPMVAPRLPAYRRSMTATHKIAIAGALMGTLAVVILRNILQRVEEIETYEFDGDVPVLQPVRDAEPQQPEPLSSDDLRVAQNSPL